MPFPHRPSTDSAHRALPPTAHPHQRSRTTPSPSPTTPSLSAASKLRQSMLSLTRFFVVRPRLPSSSSAGSGASGDEKGWVKLEGEKRERKRTKEGYEVVVVSPSREPTPRPSLCPLPESPTPKRAPPSRTPISDAFTRPDPPRSPSAPPAPAPLLAVAPAHTTRYPVRRSLSDRRPAIPPPSMAHLAALRVYAEKALPPLPPRSRRTSLLVPGIAVNSEDDQLSALPTALTTTPTKPRPGRRSLRPRTPRTPNNTDSFLSLSSPTPSAPSSPSLSASRRHSASLIAKDHTPAGAVRTSFLSLTPDASPRKPVPPPSFPRLSLKPKSNSLRARKTASSSSTTTTFSASHSASGIMGWRLDSRPSSLVSALGNRSSSYSAKTGSTGSTGAVGAGGGAEKLPGKVVMGGRPLGAHPYALAKPVGA